MPFHIAKRRKFEHIGELLHPDVPYHFLLSLDDLASSRLWGVPRLAVLAAAALVAKIRGDLNALSSKRATALRLPDLVPQPAASSIKDADLQSTTAGDGFLNLATAAAAASAAQGEGASREIYDQWPSESYAGLSSMSAVGTGRLVNAAPLSAAAAAASDDSIQAYSTPFASPASNNSAAFAVGIVGDANPPSSSTSFNVASSSATKPDPGVARSLNRVRHSSRDDILAQMRQNSGLKRSTSLSRFLSAVHGRRPGHSQPQVLKRVSQEVEWGLIGQNLDNLVPQLSCDVSEMQRCSSAQHMHSLQQRALRQRSLESSASQQPADADKPSHSSAAAPQLAASHLAGASAASSGHPSAEAAMAAAAIFPTSGASAQVEESVLKAFPAASAAETAAPGCSRDGKAPSSAADSDTAAQQKPAGAAFDQNEMLQNVFPGKGLPASNPADGSSAQPYETAGVSSSSTDHAPAGLVKEKSLAVCSVCLDEVADVCVDTCGHAFCLQCCEQLCGNVLHFRPALCPICRLVIPGFSG